MNLVLALCIAAIVQLQSTYTAFGDPKIIRAEAHGGGAVGVGKVVFRMDENDQLAIKTNAVFVSSPDHRIFYPAFSNGLLEQLYSQQWTSGMGAGGTHTVWFLFRGDEPIEFSIRANGKSTIRIEVNKRRPGLRSLMMNRWWQQFNGALRLSQKIGDVPPLAGTYLKQMLMNRLNRKDLLIDRLTKSQSDALQETLELVFGGESTKTDAILEIMTQDSIDEDLVPMIPAPTWDARAIPELEDIPEIESIAASVPEECFYLRFGQWKNQLWLKSLMEEYAGDLSRMVALRGYEQPKSADFLSQLVLESSEMDDLLGGQLISDTAVIGFDMYFEDGASVGILLEAKGKLLNSNLMGKRKRYAEQNAAKNVTLTEIEIAERKVSLLASPDNLVRSFYVQSGDYHLVSNSQELIKRFLQVGEAVRPLSENLGFKLARNTFPLEREDSAFIYVSTPFFQNLVSPEYQIGLRRRRQTTAARQVCKMARWAASHEGLTDLSLDELIKYQFLPAKNRFVNAEFDFVVKREELIGNEIFQELFVPIPDQQIQAITGEEERWYEEWLNKIQSQFKDFDPLIVAIKRYQLDKDIERVVFDARLAPFGQENYGWIGTILGPPLDYEIANSADDVASIQMSVKGGKLRPNIDSHQIFAAIQNDAEYVNLAPTRLSDWIKLFRSIPGYIGAWPKPGWVDVIPFGLGGRPDEQGYTKGVLTGLWRLQDEEFSIISFDRQRLEDLRSELEVIEAKREAQIRLRIGDVAASELAGWANRTSYQRSWQTSVSNVRSANQLTQQLGVGSDQSIKAMESLVGLNLICPLSGEYKLVNVGDAAIWQSTKWPNDHGDLPPDFQSPFLNWFKGMELEVTQVEGQFSVHGSLDILRHSQGIMTLPSFNLFKGFPAVKPISNKKESAEKDN